MLRPLCLALSLGALVSNLSASENRGYYRFPALWDSTLVFTAEGDLWKVSARGGEAQRLTSHPGMESHAAISPDGTRVAFSGSYEGPTEVYVMPLTGGLPERLTYSGDRATVVGWTPDGEILYSSRDFSTLPQTQLARISPQGGQPRVLPLAQASDGAYDADGETLFFTRLRFQGSHTKRYRGGTAQNLWRFTEGAGEAAPLTSEYPGTSRAPMLWEDRLYFVSDRDGTMNLWSAALDGGDPRQLTRQVGWDVKSPSLSAGRIVYQTGPDLFLFDLASGEGRRLDITLASDFDQRRETWVEEPMDYLTAAHLSPEGDRVVLTARGQVFVVPVGPGRRVEASRNDGVRYRSARFLDDERLVALSDESGEVEWWSLDSRGLDPQRQITEGGTTLRFDGLPSPDGRWIAFHEKDNELWIAEVETGEMRRVAVSPYFTIESFSWSPDSRWLAYALPQTNHLARIEIYGIERGETLAVTSDRFESTSPAWSPDGRWLYFLSNRNLVSLTRHPWGSYQPQPYLDRKTLVYKVALRGGERSPFLPPTELHPAKEKDKAEKGAKEDGKKAPELVIEAEGLAQRLWEVPVPAGNYQRLEVSEEALFLLATETTVEARLSLQALPIEWKEPKLKTLVGELESFELSADRRKLLVRTRKGIFVFDAKPKPPEKMAETKVDLSGWAFRLDPQQEWRQMFVDAWRLMRDYFYDPGMHGVDWTGVRNKYLPMVARVSDRAELGDLFGEMVGELSALHHFVRGGDLREGDLEISPSSLGAELERDEATGGFRITRLYDGDPDLPVERSPLSQPGVEARVGDVIIAVNGIPARSELSLGRLLRHQAGRQVLLDLAPAGGDGETRKVIVEPLRPEAAAELRYDVWEHERRLRVEEAAEGRIGYVHLRAMSSRNYSEWARHFFPVFNRQGLIIDVRNNRGGNIDSWILGTLLRRAWMWWQPRAGIPYSNMQFAFGGHMVVLTNESTASDGEAFAEGFRRLGLGEVIGTRTWGGEIWLTSSNRLVDGGIATAAEFGVYGPEGEWLIEGHGVEPDLVVDNLPHATFRGEDAQLDAAIEFLEERIRRDPPEIPEAPPYPDKSFPGAVTP